MVLPSLPKLKETRISTHHPISNVPWSLPPAVNFHLEKQCNLRCSFCYATFDDDPLLRATRHGLAFDDSLRVIEMLRDAGAEKITFVGGEPTLCPHLPALLRASRELGFVTTLVTNGARLQPILDEVPNCIDWVGLSVDSSNEATQAALGRGRGDHVAKSIEHFRRLHELGIRVKLNTVVTALNWQEDMNDFVLRVRPERWKIFQVLPIEGQNSGAVEPLLISAEDFMAFVDRHRGVAAHGVTVAAETNEDMTGSYAMIDPLGRFFSNVDGRYLYSPPILEVGVASAFRAVTFDPGRFVARGGRYDWGTKRVPLTVSARS